MFATLFALFNNYPAKSPDTNKFIIVQDAFNRVMNANGLNDVDDSTSSLTSKPMAFDNDPTDTYFHIDLAINTERDGYIQRLIHDKHQNVMIWNKAANIATLKRNEAALKEKHWLEVCEVYIHKKNQYINDKERHPSFVCYKEAVNELYNKYFY